MDLAKSKLETVGGLTTDTIPYRKQGGLLRSARR